MPKTAKGCPYCSAFVKPANLPAHLRKAHGKSDEAARLERSTPRPSRPRARFTLPIWIPILALLIVAGAVIGVYWSSLPPAPLPPLTGMCVQHEGLGIHYHVQLYVTISGTDRTIPANIGIISSTCYRPLHTHDASGVIHVELPGARPVYLKDFFSIWGETFSRTNILGYQTGGGPPPHTITFSVNGAPNSDYESLLLADQQVVRITYQ